MSESARTARALLRMSESVRSARALRSRTSMTSDKFAPMVARPATTTSAAPATTTSRGRAWRQPPATTATTTVPVATAAPTQRACVCTAQRSGDTHLQRNDGACGDSGTYTTGKRKRLRDNNAHLHHSNGNGAHSGSGTYFATARQ